MGRVPHLRPSVRGPKKMGAAQQSLLLNHLTSLNSGEGKLDHLRSTHAVCGFQYPRKMGDSV
jgi:hypothetical protein